jgi:hypothetical protein
MDAEITDPAVLRFLYGWPTGEDFLDAVEGTGSESQGSDGIQLTPRKPVWMAKSSAVTIPLVPPNPPRNKIKVKVQRRGHPGPTIKEISAEEAAEFEARAQAKKSVHFAPNPPASTHRSKRRRVDAGGILRPASESVPALTHQNSGPNVFTMSDIQ